MDAIERVVCEPADEFQRSAETVEFYLCAGCWSVLVVDLCQKLLERSSRGFIRIGMGSEVEARFVACTLWPCCHYLRSEEHTSELQSLMRISYAVFCLTKKKQSRQHQNTSR